MLKQLSIASSVLALSAVMSLAQTAPAPSSGTGTSTVQSPARSSEYQAFQNAKVSLAQAIETAERQGGGRAIDAEFEVKSGTPGRYEVKVLTQDGKILKYKLDANSGQVVETENEPFEAYFTRLKPADLQAAKTSLKDAIGIAEQRIGGRAIEAEVEREGASVLYEIEVISGDRKQEIKIDANGQVTKG